METEKSTKMRTATDANTVLAVVKHDLFSEPNIPIKRQIYKLQSQLAFDRHVEDTAVNGFENIATESIKRKTKLHNELVAMLG